MADPDTVTNEQMRAAYDALGLDPDRWKATRSIHISPHDVEVVRIRKTNGKTVIEADEIATDVVTIRLA